MQHRKQVDLLLKQGKVKEAVNLLSDLGASNRDAKQARALFEECLALDSQHFESQANLALLDLEDDTVSIVTKLKSFENAVRINPQWFDGLKTLASLLDDCGNEPGAIEMYRKAIRVDPNNVDVMLDLVLMLAKSGDLSEALQTCKQALRLDSKHDKGNLMLAELLWRSGYAPKQVVVFCQRALEYTTTAADSVIQLNACLVAATALEQDGNVEQAVRFLESACSLPKVDTTNARIRLNALLFALNKQDSKVLMEISPVKKDDLVGRAMLLALANESNATVPQQQQEYSQLAEAFLLNCHFNDTFALIHKVSLYRNTVLMDSNALPKSHIVTSWDEVHALVEKNSLYFLKNPSVQRGQGILLVNSNTPCEVGNAFFAGSAQQQGKEFLLQEAVHPPFLLDGEYKFGLRTHVLVVKFAHQSARSVFVFKESILTRCWDKYDVNKTDALTHISSTSIQRNQQGFNRDQVKGLASKMFASGYPTVFEKLKPKLFACCQACLTKSSITNSTTARPMVQLFGFDSVVLDGNLEPFIAEANAAPQFQDAKRTQEMLQGFALPMTHGACEILCAGFASRKTGGNWDYVGDLL